MNVDNTKLLFNSNWDIDQILYQGEVDGITLNGNTSTATSILLFPFSLSYPPVIDGTFQLGGETIWRQIGDSTTSGKVELETFLATTPTGIYLVYYNFNTGSFSVNVRYYIWTDTVLN